MNKKTETQKFWNRNPCCGDWSSIDNLIAWRNKTEPYVQEVLRKVIVPGKKVLEVGCGQGIELIQNLERNIDMYAIDYSKNSLLKAKSHFKQRVNKGKFKDKKFKILRGDAEDLPFRNSEFDVVYSMGVLHHTPNTQKGIDEINRVLNENGVAVIMLYHRFSWRSFPIASLRFLSKILDKISRKNQLIYRMLARKYEGNVDSVKGTTLMELFGCPVLKMYTKNQMRKMMRNFSSVEMKCYSSNLFQLTYLLPIKPLYGILRKIDRKIDNTLGFHLVAICRK